MGALATHWKTYSEWGAEEGQELRVRRQVILTNQLCFFFLFLSLLGAVVIPDTFSNATNFISLTARVAVFFTVPLLNRSGHITPGRLLFSVSMPFFVLISIALLKDVNEEYREIMYFAPRLLLLSTAILPLVLLNMKRWVNFTLGIGSVLIALILFDPLHNFLGVGYGDLGNQISNYFIIDLVSIMGLTIIVAGFLFWQSINDSYSKELFDSYKDISESQETLEMAYKRLQDSEQHLQELYAEQKGLEEALNQSLIVATTDLRGHVINANDKFCKISKYTREELIGKNHNVVNSGLHDKEFWKTFWRTIARGNIWRGEIRNQAKDGSYYWTDTTVVAIKNDKGRPMRYLSLRIDITEKKKFQEQVQEERAFMQRVIDNLPNMLLIKDYEGNIKLANKAAAMAINGGVEDMINRNITELNIDKDEVIAFLRTDREVIDEQKKITIEEPLKFNTGEERWTYTTKVPIEDAKGQPLSLGISIDITDRKNQELVLQKKNKEINDSLNYAKRIQRAIMGDQAQIIADFKDAFIFFEPRTYVSGDFYWYSKREDGKRILAVADCTGHGVPAAFMTVMGNDLLDEAVNEQNMDDPAKILYRIDRKVLARLHQQPDQKHQHVNDGMDMTIVIIDEAKQQLKFAMAKQAVFHIREDKLNRIKGSMFPIGSMQFSKRKIFETIEMPIVAGDKYYIFSDGFQDQFGGTKNMKYMSKRYRSFIQDIMYLPMSVQKQRLEDEFMNWKGERPQTDDVLIVGFEV
ncbi:MAG: PAS domain S-box protein [Bernardetiaceae bacterium]|nr:PAS domain S-box protein [Bernardetiaceae bacterium]